LANGLGGRLYAWLPVLDALADRYRIVTWDYRGLFESEAHLDRRRLGVPQHAEDLAAVLDAEGIDAAHLCGWSMGVQVSLEFSLRRPDRVRSLVLINGTYGQALSTAFQPLMRVPLPPTVLHAVLEGVADRPTLAAGVGQAARAAAGSAFWLRKRLGPRWRSHFLRGIRQYVNDVMATHKANYLHLFQQIDAHSVYHLLPEVQAPTLVVSGGLDFLTPAYQSRAMARRIPGAKHLSIPLGTHFVLLEYPERVVAAIEKHLARVER
ncbi:MAG: alpha/beta hydrolase, partial [Myxococcales bacterium]|nr:alpha/beta hydrolase [Myxococcales bacterium]